LTHLDSIAADIEGRAKDAGVPIVVVLVPNRAQAAMLSMNNWPAGYNPYKLDDELRSIVTCHGGIYISIARYYREVPAPELKYFPIDGHPDADGHAMLTWMLAKELTAGSIPELRITALRQTELEQNK
jgi:hypothetical protein